MELSKRRSARTSVAVAGLSASMLLAVAVNGAAAAPVASPKPTAKPVACAPEQGVDATSVKIGLIYPKSGPAAPSFKGFEESARLRIDQTNAKGGVNGRKIIPFFYDDQANGGIQSTVATKALQDDKVFGIVVASATDSMFPMLKSQNVPVTGFNAIAMSSDRNAFSATGVPTTGTSMITTTLFERLKAAGATKVANIGHGTPGVQAVLPNYGKLINASGMQEVLRIADEPQGAHDATSTALRIRQSGADGVLETMFVDGGIAIQQALAAQGVKPKAIMLSGLVDPAVVAKAAGPLEGVVGSTYGTVPAGVPGRPGLRTFINGMKAAGLNPYTAIAPIGFVATDLMMKGISVAGPCLSRQGFIDSLRKVTKYDAAGMAPQSFSFAPGLLPNGTPVKCSWYVTAKNGLLVPDAKATCGDIVDVNTGKVLG